MFLSFLTKLNSMIVLTGPVHAVMKFIAGLKGHSLKMYRQYIKHAKILLLYNYCSRYRRNFKQNYLPVYYFLRTP